METDKRLIDANALIETLSVVAKKMAKSDAQKALMGRVLYIIEHKPTVDAVEVAHGRWIFGTANHREYMKCSECLKSQTPTGVFTYCPNCGAKMDGERKNE